MIGIIILSVCLSICLWCCALWLNDTTAKVSEQVNRKCPLTARPHWCHTGDKFPGDKLSTPGYSDKLLLWPGCRWQQFVVEWQFFAVVVASVDEALGNHSGWTQTPDTLNFTISLTTACGYTICHTAKMSEQANRKSVAAYIMVQPYTPTPTLSPQILYRWLLRQ